MKNLPVYDGEVSAVNVPAEILECRIDRSHVRRGQVFELEALNRVF